MFNILKRKNSYESLARQIYALVLSQTRDPIFYDKCAIPDSLDGRFDLLLLHLFLIQEHMLEDPGAGSEFNQTLFDVTFEDMDQTLREMGIGDMSIPKHMRRMMKAFNGRMHAYTEAARKGTWSEALTKNLYGTVGTPSEEQLDLMISYIKIVRDQIRTQTAMDVLKHNMLPDFEKIKRAFLE